MTKADLKQQLDQKHGAFTAYIASLSDADFTYTSDGKKWTAGQQSDHIRLSVKPLITAFGLPKWVMAVLFGKAKSSPAGYEEVVTRYRHILDQGGKAGKNYTPKIIPVAADRESLKSRTDTTVARMLEKLDTFTETDLDRLRLPHPLIGKMTVREMLYFTLYHVQHHHEQTRKNLENRS